MRILEMLAASREPLPLEELARALACDERTIRRDLEEIQNLLQRVRGLAVRRGRCEAVRSDFGAGYFAEQVGRNAEVKRAIARSVVALLQDEWAIALSAGSTAYAVAQEIASRAALGQRPSGLIVFTNSLPALQAMAETGLACGVLGEIYVPEDCALHSPELRSAFQPNAAVVGASGVQIEAQAAGLELYSHRADEAAFLRQLLARAPEVIVAAESRKLGRRHPWSFGGPSLAGKRVTLVTDGIHQAHVEEIERAAAAGLTGMDLRIVAAESNGSNGWEASDKRRVLDQNASKIRGGRRELRED